jgi:hypothetical protein
VCVFVGRVSAFVCLSSERAAAAAVAFYNFHSCTRAC